MSIERANKKAPSGGRHVTMPGKRSVFIDKSPVDIARELRAKSSLGRREAKLAEAERKLNG
ncbi:hypothetical protein AB4Z34_33490 [Ensifer sp. 2YAB10]